MWATERRIFYSLLVVLPFVVFPFVDEVFYLPKKFVFSLFLFVIYVKRRLTPCDYLSMSVLLLTLVLLISSFRTLHSLYTWFTVGGYFLYFLSVRGSNLTPGLTVRPMLIPPIFIGIYALFQRRGIDPIMKVYPVFEGIPRARVGALLGGPIPLSGFLTLVIPLSLYTALCDEDKRWRFMGFLSYIISFSALFAAASRIALLASIFTTFILMWHFAKRYIKSKYLRGIIPILTAVFLLIPLIFLPSVKERFSSALKESVYPRVFGWYVALNGIVERPFIGNGLNTFHLAYFDAKVNAFYSKNNVLSRAYELSLNEPHFYQPHNFLLEIGYIAGLSGVVLVILITVFFIKTVLKNLQKEIPLVYVSFILSIISLLIFASLQPIFNFPSIMVYFLTIAGVLSKTDERLTVIPRILSISFVLLLILLNMFSLVGSFFEHRGKVEIMLAKKSSASSMVNYFIEKADKSFSLAHTFSPWEGEVLYWKGYTQCVMGNFERCVELFEDSTRSFRSPELYYNMGVAYEKMGFTVKAVKCYETAFAFNRFPPALEKLKQYR